ncbi:hypothetical protein [Roseisolibacter sp. H3M3-2]|uniref:hypothetical protein n=1 Tax=Roseisolibacter sp. H3M3-2 TaxID=3031323 RepID=UPI0023DCE92C|nr:hypothetical protein [Roseisolibacter sp. H3M3-2]MDF1501728.1 hypothetical protein [Roseisolibacter sp. H3M3-2]
MADPTCHRALRRFWFMLSAGPGIGVTAASEAEARELAEATRARFAPEAVITGVTPDVDVSTLDAAHVVPNAGPVVVRGVWFPRLSL